MHEGEYVDVCQADGKWLGRGIFNPHSRIRVRVYCWKKEDEAWFEGRLKAAIAFRKSFAKGTPNEAQRIVFSEADQLSGLIVDRYADYIVVQQTAAAITPFLPQCVEQLVEAYAPKGILKRIDEKSAASEGLTPGQEWLYGSSPQGSIEIEDNGLRWQIDLEEGQKTGYYLDQRQNRRVAADWMKPGGRALDVCCYVGGFALSIAKWGNASEVVAIDTSAKAIEQAKFHATLNGIHQVDFRVGDFYDSLESLRAANETFDLVVLDPPRLAGSRSQIDSALRAYHRLNVLGIQVLRPGGILVTCSCSGRVDRESFNQMLMGASRRAGRDLQVLERRAAAVDHPSVITCPETDYLKCYVCRVLG